MLSARTRPADTVSTAVGCGCCCLPYCGAGGALGHSFHWTNVNELVLITNQGLEFYHVNPEKRTLKLVKSLGVSVKWQIYSHENRVLLLSSTANANVIHPYHFKRGQVTRLPKFEVELAPNYNQIGQKLLEREVNIGLIYDRLYCMIIKNNPRDTAGPKAEMSLCKLTSREGATKTATLVFNMNGTGSGLRLAACGLRLAACSACRWRCRERDPGSH